MVNNCVTISIIPEYENGSVGRCIGRQCSPNCHEHACIMVMWHLLAPALGNTWAHCVNVLLLVSAVAATTGGRGGEGGGAGDGGESSGSTCCGRRSEKRTTVHRRGEVAHHSVGLF